MANISKIKRDRILSFLETLKKTNTSDESIRAFNEIENELNDKKYGLVFEEHTEEVDEELENKIPVFCEDKERKIVRDPKIPYSFLIEGDNLQALYLLEKTHKGKIDCIYIDPPYNTGAHDWKYNNDYVDTTDAYRHSKWLSMMKNRLKLAQTLLNPNHSALIVTIDEKEYLHLGCLLEEMFPTARMQMISTIIKPEGTNRMNEFSRTNEYIFFLVFGDAELVPSQTNMFETELPDPPSLLNPEDDEDLEEGDIGWRNLRRRGDASFREFRPNQFYPIFINKISGRIESIGDALAGGVDRNTVATPEGSYALWPLNPAGRETMWGKHYETTRDLLSKGYLFVTNGTNPDKAIVRYLPSGIVADIDSGKILITGRGPQNEVLGHYKDKKQKLLMPKTVWFMPAHNSQTNGSLLIKKVIGENRFSFPKSLYAVRDSIRFFVADKPNAVVLDFFAGSGTTLHAVNLLNEEDGGHRTCILVTNNEISEAEEKDFAKKGIKKGDPEWEAKGIARYVTWPRTLCSITGKDVFGKQIKGDYFRSDYSAPKIPMSKGFAANVKYFRCDWIERKPEDYLLSNALCLHIKEMIELQNAIEINNINNVLILNKDDFQKYVVTSTKKDEIKHIWVNQNIVFSASELEILNNFNCRPIPNEFFGTEIKEAGE